MSKQYLSAPTEGMDTLSNTEHYTRPAPQFYPKRITRIIDRARSLVEDAKEPNATVLVMAKTVIEDFADIIAENPKMTFGDAITAAKQLSATPPNQHATWEHTCGSAMGASALALAAKTEMRTISYGKALVQMNRTIAHREQTHEQRARGNETRASSRHPKSTAPVSIGAHKDTQSSRKRQPAKARRRKAA